MLRVPRSRQQLLRTELNGHSTPNAKMLKISEYSVEIGDPQDQHNHHDAIQDRFDLSLHWDKPVHKPQQKPCCDDCDQDGAKWHFTTPIFVFASGRIFTS
jgi:hypothetical protein